MLVSFTLIGAPKRRCFALWAGAGEQVLHQIPDAEWFGHDGPSTVAWRVPRQNRADGICRGAASRSSSLIRMARLPQR